MNIYVDSKENDDCRRAALYQGDIFVHSPCRGAVKLCELAKALIAEAFRPLDPLTVHEVLPVERCVEILAELKPRFIHHPEAKAHVREMLSELGCDLNKTYFDVPRLRTAFPGDYLTSGIAYAFHPHRDTWYSAPPCQVNWWMPVYPISGDRCMAFHPYYWNHPVKNGSRDYNYDNWVRENRKTAAQHVYKDTRVQPRPEEPIELEPEIRVVCDVGGVFLFSAAHLHSTVPNSSALIRYSIDFRTVNLDDVYGRSGALNVDSECTGTTMRDYLRGSDLSAIPDDAVALYADS